MRIKIITVTGADESVAPEELSRVSKLHPRLEWGILIAPKLQGCAPRYPSKNWMRLLDPGLSLSFHLCASASKDFLSGRFSFAEENPELWERAKRVQINFSAGRNKVNIPGVAEIIEDNSHLDFIIQLHGKNHEVLDDLLALGLRLHCLFDTSGGRGVETIDWPQHPVGPALACYAGGLRPEKLQAQLTSIAAAAGDNEVGIDMETSLRHPDEAHFSIDRCIQAARAVEAWEQAQAVMVA